MRALIALLLTLTLLTGCAALTPPAEDDDSDWEAFQQSQQNPVPEEKKPSLPGSFSLAYHKGHTLDPVTCGDGIQQDVGALLYEPLFALDQHFTPVPVLCESYDWDDSGLVCSLTLREDVLFSDGTPLAASDVTATLRRAMESPRYGYRLRNIANLSIRSGKVIITLAQPDRGLPALLDIPIVKKGSHTQTAPIGTGPYVPITGAEEDYLTVNQEWWQHKPLPVENIPLVHAKDRDAAMYLFSSHHVELLTTDPTSDLISVTGPSQVTERPSTMLQFIGFHTASGVFADSTARSAFSRGLQREMLASAFLSGHAVAAQFPISPVSPLYPAELELDYSKAAAQRPAPPAGSSSAGDGDAAEDNSPLVFLVNAEDSFRISSAKFIAESLEQSGWTLDVRILPWEEYMAALAAGEFDLYYGQVRLTADWDLRDLIGTGGGMNYGQWSDPDTDLLLAQFLSGSDQAASALALCRHLQKTMPIAPVCFQSDTVLTHSGVAEHVSPAPGNSFSSFSDWTIHLDQTRS